MTYYPQELRSLGVLHETVKSKIYIRGVTKDIKVHKSCLKYT